MKIKKYLTALIFGCIGTLAIGSSMGAEKVDIYLFWGEGCPHCVKEKDFLTRLAKEDDNIVIHDYEVYKNLAGRAKLIEASEKLNVEISGVPFLVIGDKYLVGYMSDDTTGKEIERIIEEHKRTGCFNIFNDTAVVGPTEPDGKDATDDERGVEEDGGEEECAPSEDPRKIALPKVGNIDMEKLSLPALTIVLGFLDGFNPCAMWVLLFLISLLIGMKDRKKMWILGIAFIVASAFVYFLFMVAWLNLFKFVGFIFWVRATIAGIAFVGGYASLKKFFSEDPSGCDVEGSEKKKEIFEKLGKITSNKSFFLALLGIIALAFAVNLVELICSAGLPAVYTQVLALNEMSGTNYYLYILLYILFFMLDDLFVFFVAMTTLKLTGITTKYVRYTRLIGGILMVIMGLLLLFKPEVLMFG
ncbi:hypothetical protein K0B04_01580 [Patescibacteria group bacterium]|nr:hypothetical protein [Patescibacteria group bacterium]